MSSERERELCLVSPIHETAQSQRSKWKIDSKVKIKTLMEIERNEMINEHTPSISCVVRFN